MVLFCPKNINAQKCELCLSSLEVQTHRLNAIVMLGSSWATNHEVVAIAVGTMLTTYEKGIVD